MTAACWHCGAAAGPRPVMAHTPEGDHPACCPGCAAAIETIHGLGLGDYYQWRTGDNPLAPPENSEQRRIELSLFEIPELVEPWLQRGGDRTSLTLLVEGIHCAACSWLIEKGLLDLPGVEQASLNLASHRLRISWRSDSDIRPVDLAERLLNLGYRPALPVRDARLAAERREQRLLLIRILVAALGTMQAMMFAVALYAGAFHTMEPVYRDLFRWFSLVVATPVVFFSGWPFLVGAWRGLRRLAPGMDLPVSLALLFGWGGSALNTILGGAHVYYESISMFVLFLLGSRWLEQRARLRVTLSLSNLRDTLPLAVTRFEKDGSLARVPAAAVRAGDEIQLVQGDVVAVDGDISEGQARVDEAVMTGEFRPSERRTGEVLVAGSRILEGRVRLRATGAADSSLLARIGNLVEQAQQQRQGGAALAQAIVPWFVITVVGLSLTTFLVHGADYGAFEYALAVLVVSCPCALALATPLSISAAVGRALRGGILVAAPDQLLNISRISDVAFDKTGTLTEGRFAVLREQVLATPLPVGSMRELVSGMEFNARHPVARALAAMAPPARISDLSETRTGVSCRYAERDWLITAADGAHAESGETVVALYCDGSAVMRFWLADRLRPEAPGVCRDFRDDGLELHLISGDVGSAVEPVARQCGIRDWHAGMRPQAKLDWLRALQTDGRRVMMTGDGINDAPALAAADLSVAMAEGPALARDAAGIYLLDDALAGLARLRPLGRAVRRILHQNLAWALLYNVLALPFAMAGLVPPWLAAIGMSASSLLVTLNASRLLRWEAPDTVGASTDHIGSAGH